MSPKQLQDVCSQEVVSAMRKAMISEFQQAISAAPCFRFLSATAPGRCDYPPRFFMRRTAGDAAMNCCYKLDGVAGHRHAGHLDEKFYCSFKLGSCEGKRESP